MHAILTPLTRALEQSEIVYLGVCQPAGEYTKCNKNNNTLNVTVQL